MNIRAQWSKLLFFVLMLLGCANITTPTGGKKDVTPPKLVTISPKDSMLNIRVNKIEMRFDEYITVSDISTEVEISPILKIQPMVVGINKKVTVSITDSLLEPNTTYRIKFGKSIKDVHEGNPFKRYTYTFSTGSYFDSLQLAGSIIEASTGLPDTGVVVILYPATAKDSDVIRKKPKYKTKVDNKGNFLFKGLPQHQYRMYALKESTPNLIYDGIGEKIAYNDSLVTPGDSTFQNILLRIFEEKVDTGSKNNDTLSSKTDSLGKKKKLEQSTSPKEHLGRPKQKAKDSILSYSVNIDTNNTEKRTFDVDSNSTIKITFNRKPVFNKDKITLMYDNEGVNKPVQFKIFVDTVHPLVWQIKTNWAENTVYTLRLIKGFAKDTTGADLMPSKYKFRTKQDDDYGKIKVVLPAKYHDTQYVLRVNLENDSVYQKKVTDTIITLKQLRPGKYSFRVIVDKNGNGIWDTGDLLGKVQPEVVIPYYETVNLKAGWELIIDFDKKPAPKVKKDKPKEVKTGVTDKPGATIEIKESLDDKTKK